jgi:hypothetical protein
MESTEGCSRGCRRGGSGAAAGVAATGVAATGSGATVVLSTTSS